MSSNVVEESHILYAQTVALPILAFPAWMLCIPPMVWQLSQRNIAVGSLILWMIILNFFNAINPLIWAQDNMSEWWDSAGLCDMEARIQMGAVVALPACAAVLARRLANVMNTRNVRLVPSKRSVIREIVLEIGMCWIYPAILMITYYAQLSTIKYTSKSRSSNGRFAKLSKSSLCRIN
ncbi:hypothetical protein BU23DRAFT_645904 [Bimuria novae-zelandiae CBS 107.79]|uniref:STE3-domain-containing protein n=1 Tax=Bimuria novae-zelandiae CBS 107.79 TaxID=1447943 RepID=A0A6A5V447_9PLEO|nr:hypothetical protein BU23DRAFT_645904 [Bimuria novae-zelandiae CBS 107.79]